MNCGGSGGCGGRYTIGLLPPQDIKEVPGARRLEIASTSGTSAINIAIDKNVRAHAHPNFLTPMMHKSSTAFSEPAFIAFEFSELLHKNLVNLTPKPSVGILARLGKAAFRRLDTAPVAVGCMLANKMRMYMFTATAPSALVRE